jgi:hypothetical protein
MKKTAIAALAVLATLAGMTVRADVGVDGSGEDLILVVAGSFPTSGDASRAAALMDARFGEVEGFSVDAAVHYAINGVHLQTSADLLPVPCKGSLFATILDGRKELLECPKGRTTVRLFRPVELAYVPRSAWATYAFPRCGAVGRPPCQRERYREVLGDAPAFGAGSHLLLTAFRTRTGAEEFLALARTLGVGGLVTVNARKLGGGDVGLGQEPHPDGSGPLVGPLPDQSSYQR